MFVLLTVITALLSSSTLGQEIHSRELILDEIQYNQRTQSIPIGQQKMIVATELSHFQSKKKIELLMIDSKTQAILSKFSLENENQSYYYPQIIQKENKIFLVYISEQLSLIQVKLKILAIDFIDKQNDIIIGESISLAKQDFQRKYIKVTDLSPTTFGLFWLSRGQTYDVKQWNLIEFSATTDTVTEQYEFSDGEYIQASKNDFGVIGVLVRKVNFYSLYSLFQKEKRLITEFTQQNTEEQAYLVVQPNNFFTLYSFSSYLKYWQFSPFLDEIQPQTMIGQQDGANAFLPYPFKLKQIFQKNEKLYYAEIFENNFQVMEIDILNNINFVQFRKIYQVQQQNTDYNFYQQDILRIDVNDENQLLARWVSCNKYMCHFHFLDINMDLDNICLSNCLKCNEYKQCQQCKEKYELNQLTKTCKPICPENCEFCTEPNYCLKCQQNYEYTTENQCIEPKHESQELIISDEQTDKGKPKILTIDNEIILIYSLKEQQQFDTLVIRKINTVGISSIIKKITYEANIILDYDLCKAWNEEKILIFIKWKSNDDQSQIIKYVLDIAELNIQQEVIMIEQIKTKIERGDQLLVLQLNDQGIGIMYIYYESENNQLSYKRFDAITNNVIQNQQLLTFCEIEIQIIDYENDSYGTNVNLFFSNTIYNIQIRTYSCYVYPLYSFDFREYQKRTLTIQNKKLVLKNIFNSFYQKQLYLDLNEDYKSQQTIQISKTSRNPNSQMLVSLSDNLVVIIWKGNSLLEQNNLIENIYMQILILETFSLYSFEKIVCSKTCSTCNELGECLTCVSNDYLLENGKCLLQCEANCKVCKVQQQCLICQDSFYLNSNLQCQQEYSENKLIKKESLNSDIFIDENEHVHLVYLQVNGNKLEVIYEELNQNGISLSGKILIFVDNQESTIPIQQPRVVKAYDKIIIFHQIMINGYYYQLYETILDKNYQFQKQLNVGNTLKKQVVYDFLINQQNLVIIFFDIQTDCYYSCYEYKQLKKCNINLMNFETQCNEFYLDNSREYINLKVNKQVFLQQIIVQFEQSNDSGFEQIIYRFNLYSWPLYTQIENMVSYYMDKNNIHILQYKQLNEYQILLKFSNALLQDATQQIIDSIGKIQQFQVLITQDYFYVIYKEELQETQQQQIIIKQIDKNGLLTKDIVLNINELQIKDFTAEKSDQFVYITWTSVLHNAIQLIRYNQALEIVPLDFNNCMYRCDICNSNKNLCDQCTNGYYFNENLQSCQPICSQNCISCSKPYTCDFCEGNYKFIDNQCTNIDSFDLERPICIGECLDIGSIVKIDTSTCFTYQLFEANQYHIAATIIDSNTKLENTLKLLSQDTQISYHKIFDYKTSTMEGFALIWLNGNCIIQCRLMLQLYGQNLEVQSNPYELKLLTIDVQNFDIQALSFNDGLIMLWNELNTSSQNKYYVATFNMQNGFQYSFDILENPSDTADFPQLILQSGFYQVIYVKNKNTIVGQIVDGQSANYKELQQVSNEIVSMAALKQSYLGIVISWIEKKSNAQFLDKYGIYFSTYDQDLLQKQSAIMLVEKNYQLQKLCLQSYNFYYIQFIYVETLLDNTQVIRQTHYYIYDFFQYYYSSYSSSQIQVNILSQYISNSKFVSSIDKQEKSFIFFSGLINNRLELLFNQFSYTSTVDNECQNNCFYCDLNQECIICKQDYELINKVCEMKLPTFCQDGDNGICVICQQGYTFISETNSCVIQDEKYKEKKINNFSSQSKQRISTFSNGDYVAVWFRQYYQNEGTGVFMALFNVHGEKIIGETRISESSAGIQTFPDVQVFSNDQFIAIWIEGDLQQSGKIKLQRFSNTFQRIGTEMIIQDNIYLKNVQRFDTPIMIQSIINGYVVLWTQNQMESNILVEKLQVNFYNSQDQLQKSQIINNSQSIKNSEPVVSSNTNFIIIVWQSNLGIIASKFSLNFVYVDQIILTDNGINPSITVNNQDEFLIVWSETVKDNLGLMSQKICYRKYQYDIQTPVFNLFIGIQEYNLYNPDVISLGNEFAIIFESRHSILNDAKNIKLIIFDNNGAKLYPTIVVTDVKNIYPHHPILTKLPQNQFLATWVSSSNDRFVNLQDDLYMKRYNLDGQQLPLDTIICYNNCISCDQNQNCQECQQGFQLVSNSCQQLIPNCKAYNQNILSILSCELCAENYKLINNQCILGDYNQGLNIEYFDVTTNWFDMISFKNGDLLYFWIKNNEIQQQRFDQYGKQLTSTQIIKQISSDVQFDVINLNDQDEQYVIVIKENCQYQFIFYNKIQEQVYTYNHQSNCYHNIANPIKLKMITPNRLILFYQASFSDKNIDQYAAIFFLYFEQGKIVYMNQEIYYNGLIPQQMYLDQNFKAEIDLKNQEIFVFYENNNLNSFRYYFITYNIFGHLIRTYKSVNKYNQIELEIFGINENTILEVWTELTISQYEVFYQIKHYNETIIVQRKQISLSRELYKLDIKIVRLSKSIAVIWREGSISTDMSQNAFYKIRLIDIQTYELKNSIVSLNTLNSVLIYDQKQIMINELHNEDIIINLNVYDFEANSPKIVAYKINNQGELLNFAAIRCENGCQECTNSGKCIKCYNSYDYLLTIDGICQRKLKCMNFKSDCTQCLDGFYMNRYGQCVQIQQQFETEVNFSIDQFQNYQLTFFQDGSYLIVYQKEEKYINAIKYSKDGTIITEKQLLEFNQDDLKLKKFSIIIDAQNNFYIFYLLYSQQQNGYYYYYYQYDLKFYASKFDSELNLITNQIQLLSQDNSNLYLEQNNLNIINNDLKRIVFQLSQPYLSILMIYDLSLEQNLGNIQVKTQSDLASEILVTEDNIILGYLNQETTIIKVYDQLYNFVKDITILDGQFIKLIQNSKGQIIAQTKNQINVLSKKDYNMISSQELKSMSNSLKLFIDDLDRIAIISYTSTQNSYSSSDSLLLTILTNTYQIMKEIQINIRSNVLSYENFINQGKKLQNQDYMISHKSMLNNGQWKIFVSQFDKEGNSVSINNIVCPAGCQYCLTSTSCSVCYQDYYLNSVNSNCERYCIIDRCQQCNYDVCSQCNDGLILQNNKCVEIIKEPRNLQYQHYIDDQCSDTFQIKILQLSETQYVVIFNCMDKINLVYFNEQNQVQSENLFYLSQIQMYDVSLISDNLYFSFVFANDLTNVNIYICKIYSAAMDFQTAFNANNSINKLQMHSINQNYLISISYSELTYFDSLQIPCQKEKILIYDSQNILLTQLSGEDLLQIQNQETCAQLIIHQIITKYDQIYVLIQIQNIVKILTLQQTGLLMYYEEFNIPNLINIKFDLDQNYYVVAYQQLDSVGLQLFQYDIAQKNIIISKVITTDDCIYELKLINQVILISWSSKQIQTQVNYMILANDGIIRESNQIKTSSSSFQPQLFSYGLKIYFSWITKENIGVYGLAFSILNDQGKFSDLQSTTTTCSSFCESCEDKNNCKQCQKGYELVFYETEASKFCKQSCESNCSWCNDGFCMNCFQGFALIDGKCTIDNFFNTAQQINEFSPSSQIQPVVGKFKDGQFLVVWSSNSADGDNWGVFAQLFDNQGKKVGNNFMVSQTSQGNQFLPQISILEDDTAMIIFIEGNLIEGALLKGSRYNKNLEKLGNEQLFANIKLRQFTLDQNIIIRILSLSNGGFVIIWVQEQNQSQAQIMLSFYDSASNLVSQNQIDNFSLPYGIELQAANTQTDIAIIYYDIEGNYRMNIYSLIGELYISQIIIEAKTNQISYIKLNSINNYYITVSQVYLEISYTLILQYYNNQAIAQGNQIILKDSCQNTLTYCHYDSLQINKLTNGFILSFQIQSYTVYGQFEHYYIDNNWNFNLVTKTSNSYGKSVQILESLDLTYFYFIFSYNSQQNVKTLDIYLQRIQPNGEIVPIEFIACPQNCRTCTTPNICSDCLQNFYNIDGYCQPICGQNCRYCFIPNMCELCDDGYYQKIQGKCYSLPVDYFEAYNYYVSQQQKNLVTLEKYNNEQTILFTQQTLYNEKKEIFGVNIFENNNLIKSFEVQTDTMTTNYYSIQPFYINENLILFFYNYDSIRILKFNALQELVINQQITSINTQYKYFECVILPQINNQYLMYKIENYNIIKSITLDENLIQISETVIYQSGQPIYFTNRSPNQLQFSSNDKIVSIKDNFVSEQQCILNYEELNYYYYSCNIHELKNGNKIQIKYSSQNLNYNNWYNERNQNVYYRILDSNYTPLTIYAQIIENGFNKQEYLEIFIFDTQFIILIEQLSYVDSQSELYMQRFDNSGQKIDKAVYLQTYKNWRNRINFQTSNGFEIHWSVYDYEQYTQEGYPIIKYYTKQFTQNGEPVMRNQVNCIENCETCLNSYYCQICKDNYKVDQNNKCQLICPNNCQSCSSTTHCLICDTGYILENQLCVKISCGNNCETCQDSGICQVCKQDYILNTSQTECQPVCPSNCSSCTEPLQCNTCSTGYILTTDNKCQSENSSILEQIKNTTVGTPIIGTFPDGSYVLMWYQNGENAGVYFQLYNSDNTKVGDATKIAGTVRRILNEQSINQQYYADIMSIDYQFYVLWMDSSTNALNINLNEYNSDGSIKNQLGSIGVHEQIDLSQVTSPCQIKRTANNNILLTYIAPESDDSYSLFVKSFDSQLANEGKTQEIKKVNQLVAPSIITDDNGLVSITYQSDGYIYVQQLTQEGEKSNPPTMIGDSSSLTIKIASLENQLMAFLWENKNLQLAQPQFSLNYQLISKDLKTRSEVKSISEVQVASLTPDITAFNDGFIVTWRITEQNYKSSGIQFQIFNSLGNQITSIIDVDTEGTHPSYPKIQIINDSTFAVTWTAKNVDTDGTILGDGIFMQKYNSNGLLVTDTQSLTDLCSYQCQSCQSPLICLKCQYGYYLDSTNACKIDCGTFCDVCEIPWTCQVCKNGYERNNNDLCIETECSKGYNRNQETKLCDPECPSSCKQCLQPNVCLSCKEGFILEDQDCSDDCPGFVLDSQSTIMAIVIILLTAGFLSLLACSITLYCKYRKIIKSINPSFSQVHPLQDQNKSISCVSGNVSIIRLNQNEQ